MSVAASVTRGDFEAWLRDFAAVVRDETDRLTELDAAVGDADHGTNMDRGMAAVVAALDAGAPEDVPGLFTTVGMTLVSNVGGASGPLYGTFFLRFGSALPAAEPVDAAALGTALRAGVGGIQARGKAEVDDKTMYDVWAPAVDAYDTCVAAGGDVAAGVRAAVEAATAAADRIVPLVARKGRASYLGERSAGHPDPGAASSLLLLEAAVRTLSG